MTRRTKLRSSEIWEFRIANTSFRSQWNAAYGKPPETKYWTLLTVQLVQHSTTAYRTTHGVASMHRTQFDIHSTTAYRTTCGVASMHRTQFDIHSTTAYRTTCGVYSMHRTQFDIHSTTAYRTTCGVASMHRTQFDIVLQRTVQTVSSTGRYDNW